MKLFIRHLKERLSKLHLTIGKHAKLKLCTVSNVVHPDHDVDLYDGSGIHSFLYFTFVIFFQKFGVRGLVISH